MRESDELYVLSARSDASIKVRDGVLDVKRLEDVNRDGLERWRPVLKAGEPVAAAEVASALTELGVEAPPLARSEYTFAELVDELVAPSPRLLALRVHKRRERSSFGGCTAEILSNMALREGRSTALVAT